MFDAGVVGGLTEVLLRACGAADVADAALLRCSPCNPSGSGAPCLRSLDLWLVCPVRRFTDGMVRFDLLQRRRVDARLNAAVPPVPSGSGAPSIAHLHIASTTMVKVGGWCHERC
jgi:hypothetical protein